MVLSRKKLKKQKLLAQGSNEASVSPPPSKKRTRPPAQPSDDNGSDEPIIAPPDDAEGTAIDQSEIERYHDCLQKVLRGESEPKQQKKKKKQMSNEVDRIDATEEKHWEELPSAPSGKDNDLMDSEPRNTKKKKRKNNRDSNPSNSYTAELTSSEHVNQKASLIMPTTNGVYPEVKQIEEKQSALSVKDNDLTDPKTVYVGGIPFYSSEDDILAFFRDCGTISSVVYKTFPDSGKFRGIALLTFKTEGGAQRALAMDGASMGSCFLKIQPCASTSKEATKEVHKEPPKKTEGYTRAYIGNLSWDITEEDIRSLFVDCKIDAIRFPLNKTTGEFQGFGHVDFSDDESLERALQLDQQIVLGRPIKIAYAVVKQRNEKAKENVSTKYKGKKR